MENAVNTNDYDVAADSDSGRSAGMQPDPGTYVVIFRCNAAASERVGRLGRIDLRKGYYGYVGSAFGPGGVRARISRHWRLHKKVHWHIDYLRHRLVPLGAWYSHAPRRLEHDWANCLGGLPGATAVAGFGCSDCRCQAHLFHFPTRPALSLFRACAGVPVESSACPPRSGALTRRRGHG